MDASSLPVRHGSTPFIPSSFVFLFFPEFKGQFFREDYLLEQLIYKGQIIAKFFQSYHLTLPYVYFIIWHGVFACVHLLFVSLNCMSGSFNIACLLFKTVWGGGMGVTHLDKSLVVQEWGQEFRWPTWHPNKSQVSVEADCNLSTQ